MFNSAEHIYGEVPSHWQLLRLGDLVKGGQADLQTGPFGTMLHASAYKPVGTPVVAVKHIGDNRLLHEANIPRVDEETHQKLYRYELRTGDILFGRKGAVERRALVTDKEHGWLQGSDCIRLRLLDPKIDPVYISYVLGSTAYRNWIVRHAHGATMPSLNQQILSLTPLPLPPADEQKAIAHILGTLDDKIELNQQMNHTLEAIARALFKSWFIDFDPIHAKMDGRQPAGMDAETAALFPANFEDSPLGKIPEGWRVEPLDQIADFLNGLALQKYPPEGDDYLPVVKIAELRKGITESSGKASPNIDKKYIIQDGDILFSWSGSLEALIWCGGKGALNQHLFKVTSRKYPKWFYYEWVKFHLPNFRAIAASKATTMGHIQRHHLTAALGAIPSNELMEVADKRIAPLLDKFINNNLESRTLTSVRDSLLPKLLSSDISVKDAEKVIEKVA